MEQIQLYGKNEISVYMISTKIKTIVEEDSIADIFCSYIIEAFAKMPDGKSIDLVLVYNIKRFLEFFYTEVLGGDMDEINWRENDPNGFYIDAIGERSDRWLSPEPFLDVFDKLVSDYSLRRNEYVQILYRWITRNGEHIYMNRE
jgi:hypothetical protein